MRSFSVRRGIGAASLATVVLAGALAGCGAGSQSAGPESSASPPPSTSSAPKPSTSPTPSAVYKPADANGPAENVPVPVKPAAADEFSKAGIEAFAKYWYETLSYLYRTGDSKPMESITDSSCVNCTTVQKGITGWYAGGNWIAGGAITIEAVESKFVKTDSGQYQVIVQAHQDAFDHYRANKSNAEAVPVNPDIADIIVATYSNGHWTANIVDHR